MERRELTKNFLDQVYFMPHSETYQVLNNKYKRAILLIKIVVKKDCGLKKK